MATIDSVTIDAPDTTAAERFRAAAFGVGPWLRLRASEAPTTGFRGFTMSLVVSRPATMERITPRNTPRSRKPPPRPRNTSGRTRPPGRR